MTTTIHTSSVPNQIECPCEHFTTMSNIVKILEGNPSSTTTTTATTKADQHSMKGLFEWLQGSTDEQALSQDKLLSCGKRSRCRFRYGISFAVLNAIRDACRPHLERFSNAEGVSTTVQGFSRSREEPEPYEEAFPSLQTKSKPVEAKPHPAAANILVPRKKTQSTTSAEETNTLIPRKKNKRRIRPAQVTEPIDRSASNIWNATTTLTHGPPLRSAWGKVDSSENTLINNNSPLNSIKRIIDFSPKNETPNLTKSEPAVVVVAPNVTSTATSEKKTETGPELTKEVPEHLLENLTTLYVALIENMLVPSTPLELHFLIRLLELDVVGTSASSNEVVSFFQPILHSAWDCRRFSIRALEKLEQSILKKLPIPLLHAMVQCENLQRLCPDLTNQLNPVIEEYKRKGMQLSYPRESVTGSYAILSLPFNEERDSRHNYRTPVEVAVYKNREESRDSFLTELRTFMSVKGKLFRPQDIDGAQNRVRHEAQHILKGLMSVNVIWFAQFYCELLIQVGLAPVEETDQDLLNIAGIDKLQKLHKRISSRSANTGKSSKKISTSHRSASQTDAPFEEARTLFSGYQEFFFLFLCDVPYNFGFHLRARLAKTMIKLLSNISTVDLEIRILRLKLLGRFLGYLIFSPNWQEAGIDSRKIQSTDIADGLRQLCRIGLPLEKLTKQAWTAGHLVVSIPWVTELLRMAKWDYLTQASMDFRQLLADLRWIQSSLLGTKHDVACFAPIRDILAFQLENFFDEVFGLPKLTSLPVSSLTNLTQECSDAIDESNLGFSCAIIFSCSPHIEEVFSLLDHFGKGIKKKSSSKARKLRPSMISSGSCVGQAALLPEGEKGSLPTPEKATRPLSNTDTMYQPESVDIETKLVGAFFHQHRELKEFCDFAMNQVVIGCRNKQFSNSVKAVLREHRIFQESSDTCVSKAHDEAHRVAMQLLEDELRKKIGGSLVIFFPHEHHKVLEIATNLTITQGLKAGASAIQSLVGKESKAARLQRNVAELPTMESSGQTPQPSANDLSYLLAAIERIIHAFSIDEVSSLGDADVIAMFDEASDRIKRYSEEMDGSVPGEATIRSIMTMLLRLDKLGSKIVAWCSEHSEIAFGHILERILRFLLTVTSVSSYGLKDFVQLVDAALILRMVQSITCSNDDCQHLTQLLEDLAQADFTDKMTILDCASHLFEPNDRCWQVLPILKHLS